MEGNRRSLDSRIATGAVPRMTSVPLEYIAGLGFPSGHKFLSALQLADGATFRKVCSKWMSMATSRPDLKGWNDEVLGKAAGRAEAALKPPGNLPFLTLFRDRSADSNRTKWWVFDGCHRAFGLTCLLLREEKRSGLAGEPATGVAAAAPPSSPESAARTVPVCFVGGGRRHDPPRCHQTLSFPAWAEPKGVPTACWLEEDLHASSTTPTDPLPSSTHKSMRSPSRRVLARVSICSETRSSSPHSSRLRTSSTPLARDGPGRSGTRALTFASRSPPSPLPTWPSLSSSMATARDTHPHPMKTWKGSFYGWQPHPPGEPEHPPIT